jgi:hypothetical protein
VQEEDKRLELEIQRGDAQIEDAYATYQRSVYASEETSSQLLQEIEAHEEKIKQTRKKLHTFMGRRARIYQAISGGSLLLGIIIGYCVRVWEEKRAAQDKQNVEKSSTQAPAQKV